MNFQTSKRIMCCLMAALILCCAVVRPLEASASALATGAVVGFALEPAISSILVALGVVGATAAFTELVENISKNVPAEYIITALDGTEYLSAVNYNDITYVAQELVKWVQNCVFGAEPTVTEAAYKVQFNVSSVFDDVVDYDYLWSQVYSPELAAYSSNTAHRNIHNAQYAYAYDLTDCSWFKGFYYWGNSEPVLEWKENVDLYDGEAYERILTLTVPDDATFAAYNYLYQWVEFGSNKTFYFPDATDWGNSSTVTSRIVTRTYGFTESESLISRIDTEDLPWVYPGIHIIILPEDPEPSEPTEPEETEPPETQPSTLPFVPDPEPSEPDPDVTEPEPEVTDPVEIPDTTAPSETEPVTTEPEVTEPVEVPDPSTYKTYIPITFPNTILDPNEVTQPEVQTGSGSTEPEIETGDEVEIEDPNQTEEPINPDEDTELGDPVVWPDFPSVDTPEVPFPGYDNDYTGAEEDTSWLTKIGEWIKWLGELIKEWIKWLGELIKEWLKWLGEIIQLLPDAIAYYLKLMVQWLVEAFKPLFQKLAEWLQPLMDYLLDGLTKLFVPEEGYFDSKINELRQQFSLFDSILALLYDLKAFLVSLGSVPPVIYIPLSSATGEWYWGNRMVFVDFSWYAPYKSTMDNILSGLLWLWFAWRIVLSLPGIMQGISGAWKNAHVTYTKTGG